MKTDYQMIIDLKDFYPENRGFISFEERRTIARTLGIGSRTELELRNLRDMVVMFFNLNRLKGSAEDVLKEMDKMSAICGVIDKELFDGGWEV